MSTIPTITTPPPTTGVFPAYGVGIGPFSRPYEIIDVGSLSRTSRGTLNGAATGAGAAQSTIAGLNTALPIIYGRQRIGARITAVVTQGNNLILRCCWCIGEVDSVVGLYLNDEPLPSTCTATHYTGTNSQTRDPTLASAYAALGKTYSDTLAGDGATKPGVCYSVVVIPPGVSNGFPRLVADIKGMKVRSTEAGARAWSQNAAYVLADFIESPIYGMGRSVDWTTVATVASVNGASIGSPAETRRLLDLIIANPQSCETWLNVLREYAGCWAIPEGSKYRLVADALPTAGSAKNISAISKANPARITTGSAHSLTTGMIVQIAGVAGMTQINSAVGVVSYVSSTQFDLMGIDSSAYSTYTSGGTATQIETSTVQFTTANVLANSLRVGKRGVLQAPTIVECVYTDTSVTPWRDGTATRYASGVLAGTTPRRTSRISMPGIARYSEAYRFATERLNQSQLADLSVSFIAFDEGVKLQVGDLVDVTHPVGLSAKIVRISKLDPLEPGRWSVSAIEWDPAVYSTDVVAGPGVEDTTLPSPTAPPTMSAITLAEEVYQVETGRYASRIRVTWSEPSYAFTSDYAIEVRQGSSIVDSALLPKGTTSYATPALQENYTYLVSVSIVSTLGVKGTAATASKTLDGKSAIPTDVPSITGMELGGEVRLQWTPATDLDLTAHEIRYGSTAGAWSSATLLDRVPAPAVRYSTKVVPPGTWRFWIKALDSVRTLAYPYGQESANAAYCDIIVTSDVNAYIAGQVSFSTPTLVNMVATTGGWVSDGASTWSSVLTGNLSTYTSALWSYFNPASSGLYTEIGDLGASLTGDWSASMTYTDVEGTAVVYMQLNAAGGEATKTITAASNATPIVITASGHGYSTGDEVYITGVGGNTAANGRFKVTYVSSTQFSLQTFAGANVAGNGTYTSGGTSSRWIWNEYPAINVKTTARYARLRIATTGTVYVTSLGSVSCNVVARSEAIPAAGGTITTNASSAYVVQLANRYNKAKTISGSLVGLDAMYWVVDQVEVDGSRGLGTGYCIRFDGSDDYVTMSDQAVHSFTTGNFSLEAWVRPDNLTNAGIIAGKSNDGVTGEYVLYVAAGGQIIGSVIDNTDGGRKTFASAVAIDANVWTHIAFTYTASGTVGQLYLDGQPITTYTTTTGTYTQMRDTTYAFQVGRQTAGNYFVGCIDDVRLWNTARSAADILANYDNALTGSESGLVGYWDFDDNTGTVADDLTSNAKDGTLTGGPTWRPYNGFDLYSFDDTGAQVAAEWFGKFEGI